MREFIPLHMYSKQRIIYSDFEYDHVFDFFRYGTRLNTMFWTIEYDDIQIDEQPTAVNDNRLMRMA